VHDIYAPPLEQHVAFATDAVQVPAKHNKIHENTPHNKSYDDN